MQDISGEEVKEAKGAEVESNDEKVQDLLKEDIGNDTEQ